MFTFPSLKTRLKGFTMVELIIVIAMIAALGAVAYMATSGGKEVALASSLSQNSKAILKEIRTYSAINYGDTSLPASLADRQAVITQLGGKLDVTLVAPANPAAPVASDYATVDSSSLSGKDKADPLKWKYFIAYNTAAGTTPTNCVVGVYNSQASQKLQDVFTNDSGTNVDNKFIYGINCETGTAAWPTAF